LEHVSKCRV